MNRLYFGDCLDVLKNLHSEYPQGFIDLIYIDPPFNSKRNYNILFEEVELKDVITVEDLLEKGTRAARAGHHHF